MIKSNFSFLVSLKTDDKDKYKVYIENFERAYLNETTRFYKQKTGQYLTEHGILPYLHYADQKLKVISIFNIKYKILLFHFRKKKNVRDVILNQYQNVIVFHY
jgi:hypothetical protein